MTRQTVPITAIGGLGGSGTRVFAEMLRNTGTRIGEDLNGSLDNLWFTALFKRRAWTQAHPSQLQVVSAVRLFRQAMTVGLSDAISTSDCELIEALKSDLLPKGTWNSGGRGQQVDTLLKSEQPEAAAEEPWGWKEPNTHIFLPQLNLLLENFRYIHIIRDGLDMAFSDNTWQAENWEHMFGLQVDPQMAKPTRQLRYWLVANRAAVNYGRRHMVGRFMVIRYEKFCADPERYWPAICTLVGSSGKAQMPEKIVQPTSIGRARQHDLSVFPEGLLKKVREFEMELEKSAEMG